MIASPAVDEERPKREKLAINKPFERRSSVVL
jgi:hypothetical protein